MTAKSKIKTLFAAVPDEVSNNPISAKRVEASAGEESQRKEKQRIVGEDCVEFYDLDHRVAINLIPISSLRFIPRYGETVWLPGEKGAGFGEYRVRMVSYHYWEDTEGEGPCPAKLSTITVGVRRIARRPSRRTPGLLDPLALYLESEDLLRGRLAELDLERLKDIVSEYAMDSSKLAMKWKDRDRLIELIVSKVRDRYRKGDAFRCS